MKNLVAVFILLLSLSCSETKTSDDSSSKQSMDTHNLDWLIGDWERLNDEEDKTTFEQWSKKSTNEYLGIGYTLQEKDTVFKENLRIIKLEDKWTLEVSGVHDLPVLFEFSSQSNHSFVCENEANEFPKKIVYSLEKNQLVARVSAGDTEIPFYFKKMN